MHARTCAHTDRETLQCGGFKKSWVNGSFEKNRSKKIGGGGVGG